MVRQVLARLLQKLFTEPLSLPIRLQREGRGDIMSASRFPACEAEKLVNKLLPFVAEDVPRDTVLVSPVLNERGDNSSRCSVLKRHVPLNCEEAGCQDQDEGTSRRLSLEQTDEVHRDDLERPGNKKELYQLLISEVCAPRPGTVLPALYGLEPSLVICSQ